MKKLAYILSLVAAAAFTVVSCEKEPEAHPFGPAETAGCYGVFFPSQEASGSHVFSPVQDPSIDIIVKRTNTNGSITVPVKTTFSEDGIFTMNDVSFADGQDETTFTVRFDNAKEGANYSASFTVEDPQYASLYNSGPVSLDMSVMRVEMLNLKDPKTGEIATVSFTENYFGFVVDAKVKYFEVDGVRTCETYDEVISGSDFSLIPVGNVGFFGTGENIHLKFTWFAKSNMIDVPKQYMGFDYNDGNWVAADEGAAAAPMYVYDWFHFYTTDGGYVGSWPDWETFLEKNPGAKERSYYDGNGGFILTTRYYIPGLGGWSPDPGNIEGIVPGYNRVDYSFELAADYTSMGITPIDVEAGADVTSIKYAVYEGELTATQIGYKVDAIIDGSDESESFDEFVYDEEERKNFATLGVAPEKTGMYTLVAVAYDKDGKPQNSASVIFKHIGAEDTEKYAVDIDVFTEATPARYRDFTEYDSFAYGIIGSDITDAHVAIIEASKLTTSFVQALKEDEKGEYEVTADVLAQINGEGGFYSAVSELEPDTAYAVVVWATNGNEEALAYDVWTTTAIPEAWKPIGTGYFVDDFFTTFFKVEPQVMEVEMEQSEDDPTRFRMIYPYDGKYPYNDVGDWDDSKSYDIVFTIADAQHVYILPQKIGVDWGYGMFSIASMAGFRIANGWTVADCVSKGVPFGILEDGVITFPDPDGHSLLISMANYNNGGFYYANSNNACAIVLPEGVNPASKPASVKANKPAGMVSASSLKAAPVMASCFERDPQPVKVNVTVSYDRKSQKPSTTFDKSERNNKLN
ncbi:MAG: hypothetical protein J5519_04970 [Bacteroidales bacterium]|nr:hypothetical protein [Bacteroidales bacterium]